ncbi:hypothetical protein [Kribbella endophytica]
MTPTRSRTRLAAVLTRRRPPAAPKQEAANCPGGETRPEPAVPEPEPECRQAPSYSLIGW